MNNESIGLILHGQITNKEHLETKLSYYKKYIPNIILITFEISVIELKDMILKYVDNDNLILIPSNRTGVGIKNKQKITPFTITQPDNTFYCDSSWYKPFSHYKRKGIDCRFCVYRYFQLYGKKYDYYLLLRNDVDINLNVNILDKMKKKSCDNKIALLSLNFYKNHFPCETIERCMDKNKNFIIQHPYQVDTNIMCFYGSNVFFFGKYINLFNFLEIVNDNKKMDYNIWNNGESWFIGPYILIKENINYTNSKEETEKLINKYFDFVEHCGNKTDENMHMYFYRNHFEKKPNLEYPCVICEKENIFI